jgi:hypothetical protein
LITANWEGPRESVPAKIRQVSPLLKTNQIEAKVLSIRITVNFHTVVQFSGAPNTRDQSALSLGNFIAPMGGREEPRR